MRGEPVEYSILPDREVLECCALCRRYVSEDEEVFSAGVTVGADADLSRYESHCIQIGQLDDGSPVGMMVAAAGSDARREGLDGMVLYCSEDCGRKLKAVLESGSGTAVPVAAVHL